MSWRRCRGSRSRLSARDSTRVSMSAMALSCPSSASARTFGRVVRSSCEQQNYRASGLTLLTAAIVYWNTIYLNHAINTLNNQPEQAPDPELLRHLSPLGMGNTSTSQATTPGPTPPNPANSAPYAPHQNSDNRPPAPPENGSQGATERPKADSLRHNKVRFCSDPYVPIRRWILPHMT
jgi:hypothetical protein